MEKNPPPDAQEVPLTDVWKSKKGRKGNLNTSDCRKIQILNTFTVSAFGKVWNTAKQCWCKGENILYNKLWKRHLWQPNWIMGKRLQEKRGKINQNLSWKREMVPEQRFFRFPQCCTKFEKKKRNIKVAETPKMIGS